jgi:hypothetical protein
MPQVTDLYAILNTYAKKNNSPYIDIGDFISTLEKYAKHHVEKEPGWSLWTNDTGARVWSELSRLAAEKQCSLLSDDSGTRIFMYHFYIEIVEKAYQTIEDTSEIPFPSEESLNIIIPQMQLRPVNLEAGFFEYLEAPQEELFPVIKIIFPEDLGEALVLSNMIPKRLLEAAMLKIRNYLRSHNNKEYIQRKLSVQFSGKESQLGDMFNQILIRPFECLSHLLAGGEFSFYFWAFFCNVVKRDIKKKAEFLPEDLAALQSVYLIEITNSFFKARADKKKAKDLAFAELGRQLDNAPFLYALDAIMAFTDSKGIPLLGQYSQQDLESYLIDNASAHSGGELPDLLIAHGLQGEQWFIKKTKLIPLCLRLLIEVRPKVKKAVLKRWVRTLKSYSREPAMDQDAEFEKLLTQYTAELAPVLTALLRDTKLSLVYEELGRTGKIQGTSNIFSKGKLIPMSMMLLVRRKDLLADARIMLPFWYTLPLFAAFMAFLTNLRRKRRGKQAAEEGPEEGGIKPGDDAKEIKAAAGELEEKYVPRGHTIDSYLAELESRWDRLIDKKARRNLREDVDSLIRDRLRHILRLQRRGKVTAQFIKTLSAKIIQDTPALQELPEKESLGIYIQLYIAKTLTSAKIYPPIKA